MSAEKLENAVAKIAPVVVIGIGVCAFAACIGLFRVDTASGWASILDLAASLLLFAVVVLGIWGYASLLNMGTVLKNAEKLERAQQKANNYDVLEDTAA